MRYEMRVTAYDVADLVQVVVQLERRTHPLVPAEREVLVANVFQGTGCDDPRDWCRDALVAAIEFL